MQNRFGKGKNLKSSYKRILFDYAPHFCFFLVFFLYHLLLEPDGRDAAWFAERFCEYGLRGLPEYLRARWQLWSGRVLIEPLFVIFSGIRYSFFKAVDLFMWCLFGFSFIRCFVPGTEKNAHIFSWLAMLLLLQYAVAPMNSAGWIATMINNIWTLAAGFFCISVMVHIRQRQTCSFIRIMGALLACLFAAGTEQMCIVMLSSAVFCLLDALLQHESWLIFSLFFLISVLQLLVHVCCPGNAARIIAETATWLPEFSGFGIADRIYVGFARAMNYYMGSLHVLPMVFYISLGVAVTKQKKNFKTLLLAWLPFIILIGQPVFTQIYPNLMLFGQLNTTAMLSGNSNLLYFGICVVFIGVSVVDIILSNNDLRTGLLLLWIIATGFATVEMMGFSPTVYASGDRIFVFSQFAFAAGTMLLVKQKKMETYRRFLLESLPVLSLASVINNVVYIIAS